MLLWLRSSLLLRERHRGCPRRSSRWRRRAARAWSAASAPRPSPATTSSRGRAGRRPPTAYGSAPRARRVGDRALARGPAPGRCRGGRSGAAAVTDELTATDRAEREGRAARRCPSASTWCGPAATLGSDTVNWTCWSSARADAWKAAATAAVSAADTTDPPLVAANPFRAAVASGSFGLEPDDVDTHAAGPQTGSRRPRARSGRSWPRCRRRR